MESSEVCHFLWLSLCFFLSPSFLCWKNGFCVLWGVPLRMAYVNRSACLERGVILFYRDSMAMLHTHKHTETWSKEYLQVLWKLCSLSPAACLFKGFFFVSLLCPYVLTQLCSNQDRLVIYRRLGLRFGMQLWAQQWDHQFHVYTSSCTLIHMQKPLTAHT